MWKHEKARELLEQEGRTRKWLAEACGIEVRSLNHLLLGRRPSRSVVKLMAQALGCEESDLLDEKPQQQSS